MGLGEVERLGECNVLVGRMVEERFSSAALVGHSTEWGARGRARWSRRGLCQWASVLKVGDAAVEPSHEAREPCSKDEHDRVQTAREPEREVGFQADVGHDRSNLTRPLPRFEACFFGKGARYSK